ncbi:acetylcholinesterase-1 [Caerostris extrusa]|uniref:Carboxylic ester hydrolase n=1 Tax=Caerostris extrusa TaxID=172846 RepID=A0AAV4MNW0_CAEEX|nr:acetylcholinesterase-1 [Caerostris extrusa]
MKPLSVICLFAIAWKVACDPRFVKTASGPLKGFVSELNYEAVKIFLGIPFAQPPVGDLRFKKPEPAQPWNGTLQATQHKSACIQYTENPFPRRQASSLVLIYGGSFTYGSSRLDVYDPTALVQQGDVIVVTFNYRVGLFGFLTSNTEDAPGNVGMYDMVMALQWVNDNIEYFGGDKSSITIFGQSSGSIAVSLLCVSPLTKGLFSKAIMESGSAILMNNNNLQPNLQLSQRLAEAVDCASDDNTIEDDPDGVVGCLREQNATYLAYVLWSFNSTSTIVFYLNMATNCFQIMLWMTYVKETSTMSHSSSEMSKTKDPFWSPRSIKKSLDSLATRNQRSIKHSLNPCY